MSQLLTSKAVERATDLSGSYLRKLVREGIVKPRQDSSGRFLYTEADVAAIHTFRNRNPRKESR